MTIESKYKPGDKIYLWLEECSDILSTKEEDFFDENLITGIEIRFEKEDFGKSEICEKRVFYNVGRDIGKGHWAGVFPSSQLYRSLEEGIEVNKERISVLLKEYAADRKNRYELAKEKYFASKKIGNVSIFERI